MTDAQDFIPPRIATQLAEGETVLWWGRPRQGMMLTSRDALLVPFSLLWGGFALFWEAGVLQRKAPFPFALFGVPFVMIGLFLIFGRFFVDAWVRQRITYALTTRRVLIDRSGPWPSFASIRLDRLPEAILDEGSGGRGTIRFGARGSTVGGRNGFKGWIPALDAGTQFLAIDDVKRVFAAVQARS